MKSYYAIMTTEYAEFIKAFFDGRGAEYDDGKLTLVGLTDDEIDTFTDEIVRVDAMDLNHGQLNALVNSLRAAEATGKLIVISIEQGKYLHANHPAFMPEE